MFKREIGSVVISTKNHDILFKTRSMYYQKIRRLILH